jgi:hypothetical protein
VELGRLVLDSESSLGHFGVVFYVDSRINTPDEYRDLAPVTLADHNLPVVVRAIRMEDHRSVAAPRTGTVSLSEGGLSAGRPQERLGELRLAMHDAVAAVLPPRTSPRRPPPRNFTPHVSFAYVNRDAPPERSLPPCKVSTPSL